MCGNSFDCDRRSRYEALLPDLESIEPQQGCAADAVLSHHISQMLLLIRGETVFCQRTHAHLHVEQVKVQAFGVDQGGTGVVIDPEVRRVFVLQQPPPSVLGVPLAN